MNLSTPCSEYVGALTHGYGHMTVGGKSWRAHRYFWTLANGPIPDGQVIRHKCDNRACINLDHLELGTQAANIQDMVDRGRNQHGESHYAAKLTDSAVAYIMDNWEFRSKEYERTQAGLAARFGVHQSIISKIVNKKHWHEGVLNETVS